MQLTIAFSVLKIGWVEDLFGWVAHLFAVALQVSVEASAFVFGPLADLGSCSKFFELGFFFAFSSSILFSQHFISSLLFWNSSGCGTGMAWVMVELCVCLGLKVWLLLQMFSLDRQSSLSLNQCFYNDDLNCWL